MSVLLACNKFRITFCDQDTPVYQNGPHSRSAPVHLPKAQTLEEIESALLRKPTVLTAEELERQLRGESPARQSSSAVPNGHRVPPAHFSIPPPIIGSPQTRQHVSILSNLKFLYFLGKSIHGITRICKITAVFKRIVTESKS